MYDLQAIAIRIKQQAKAKKKSEHLPVLRPVH